MKTKFYFALFTILFLSPILMSFGTLVMPPNKVLTECYTKGGYAAAISEKYLDDVIQYSIDNDLVALQKLIDAGVVVTMKKDVKIIIVKAHLLGKVEFRLPGQTDVFWTVREGLRC